MEDISVIIGHMTNLKGRSVKKERPRSVGIEPSENHRIRRTIQRIIERSKID